MQARLKSSATVMLGGVGMVVMTLSMGTPAQARPGHHQAHSAHHHVERLAHHRGHRRVVASRPARNGSAGTESQGSFSSVGSDIVAEARRWLGPHNPTHRRSLWCAAFMNFVLERTGHRGTGSDMARSFASYGHRVSGPRVGAIAVMTRRGGGHVGVVSGFDSSGNPIIISGNYGNRVRESTYAGGRIYAYVMP